MLRGAPTRSMSAGEPTTRSGIRPTPARDEARIAHRPDAHAEVDLLVDHVGMLLRQPQVEHQPRVRSPAAAPAPAE
jgi:hypothetical protein